MKVGIVGSRGLFSIKIEEYLPPSCTEIVSGGAAGIDTCAAVFAKERGIPLKEFLPQYDRFGRAAPLVRNKQIVEYADEVIAFWDGKSKGTQFVMQYCRKTNTPCRVIRREVPCQ